MTALDDYRSEPPVERVDDPVWPRSDAVDAEETCPLADDGTMGEAWPPQWVQEPPYSRVQRVHPSGARVWCNEIAAGDPAARGNLPEGLRYYWTRPGDCACLAPATKLSEAIRLALNTASDAPTAEDVAPAMLDGAPRKPYAPPAIESSRPAPRSTTHAVATASGSAVAREVELEGEIARLNSIVAERELQLAEAIKRARRVAPPREHLSADQEDEIRSLVRLYGHLPNGVVPASDLKILLEEFDWVRSEAVRVATVRALAAGRLERQPVPMSAERRAEIANAELPKGRAVTFVAELLDEVDRLEALVSTWAAAVDAVGGNS